MPRSDPRRALTHASPPLEAREVRPWQPGEGPMRTRSWPAGGPALMVWAEGAWRRAQVVQRQDRADGTVVYAVWLTLPSVSDTSAVYRAYAWDSRCMRAAEPPAG